jgi:hypothetical protein
MQRLPDPFFNLEQFVPSLRQAFEEKAIALKGVILAMVPVKDPKAERLEFPAGVDRRSLCLTDGKAVCTWQADSFRALFRGNSQPPVLGDYPEAYNDSFVLLDMHALEISKIYGDRRDAEMREIYSALRRRPDGKSMSFVHDYMWQASAFVLATRPLSQAEFEAILARLERSCRTFEMGPSSRNYIAALRTTFGGEGGES